MAQPQPEPIYGDDDSGSEPMSALDRARQQWGMDPIGGRKKLNNDESEQNDQGEEGGQPADKPGSARERADKQWNMGGNLANQEANPTLGGGNGAAGANSAEKALSAPPIDTSKLSVAGKGWNKVIIKGITRKRASQVGGGAGVIGLFIAMYMAGASLYLVHLKELVSGDTNRQASVTSNQLQRRRTNSTFTLVRKAAQKIHVDKWTAKATAAGLNVKVVNGAVSSIASANGDIVIEMAGKSDRQLGKIAKELASGARGDAGIAFINSLDNVSKEAGSRLMGPVVKRNVYKRIFGLNGFFNWIDTRLKIRANAGDIADERQLTDALLNVDSTQRTIQESLSVEDAARKAGAIDPATEATDIMGDNIEEAKRESEKIAAGSTDETVAKLTDAKLAADSSADVGEALLKGTPKEVEAAGIKAAPKLGTRLGGKVLAALGSSFDAFAAVRQGCRVRGTLAFVKSMRNTLMAIELAKFAVRFYTISDHQRAGLASSTSIKLMSIYLAGAAGSSGVQSIIAGGAVSGAGLSKYGVGYADVGVLAAVAAFLSKVPGLEPDKCKLVNNPLVMVGGTAVGAAASFFSFGTLPAVNLSWSLGLTLANEVAFAVVLPIMLGTLSGALINGLESPGEESGNALAAAVGAHGTMAASASAALPITNTAFAAASINTDVAKGVELRSRSFAERYLDMNNSSSLLARASLYMPHSLPGIGSIAQNQLSFTSIINPFNSVLSLFSKRSEALTTDKCEDVSVQKYDIATDGFCNPTLAYVPILDLEQTEKTLRENVEIDLSGQPIAGSDFQKFIDNCFSGRAGILHPIEVSQEGETDPIDPSCVVGATDGPFTGYLESDIPEEVELGQPERVPLKKERFAAWYGYLVDEENLAYDINDEMNAGSSLMATNGSGTTGLNIADFTGPVIPCEGQPRKVVELRDGNDWSSIPPTGLLPVARAEGEEIPEDIAVYVRDACKGQTNVRTVVIGSSIHGTENGGQRIAHELLFNAQLPPDVRIISIPYLNKWAALNRSRTNKNGVNLNRNFDYEWHRAPQGPVDSTNPNFKGSSPASEPETQAVQAFLRSLGKTNLVLSYHDNLNWMAGSGPDQSVSDLIVKKYSLFSGMPYKTSNSGYGFFEAWYNHATGTPAIIVELAENSNNEEYLGRHVSAIVRLLEEGLIE